MSASLWGCELKYYFPAWKLPIHYVSLLVRLWVEICFQVSNSVLTLSASLWGCELKYLLWIRFQYLLHRQPPCEAVSWNNSSKLFPLIWLVSLLVRLWVEMMLALLWTSFQYCQPPCEAVSWNEFLLIPVKMVTRSASLWGCELKFLLSNWIRPISMSASLWGCELKLCQGLSQYRRSHRSASLWGCELK